MLYKNIVAYKNGGLHIRMRQLVYGTFAIVAKHSLQSYKDKEGGPTLFDKEKLWSWSARFSMLLLVLHQDARHLLGWNYKYMYLYLNRPVDFVCKTQSRTELVLVLHYWTEYRV